MSDDPSATPPDGWKHTGVRVVPGDFIFVPPYVPHQEINASSDEPLSCVLVRSDSDAVVVNLDIAPVETPEGVPWIDPIHRQP